MPEWNSEIRKRLGGLIISLPAGREIEIVEELSDDLQQRYEELRARGAGEDEAFREVMAEIDWRSFVPELQVTEKMPQPDTVPEGAAAHVIRPRLWRRSRKKFTASTPVCRWRTFARGQR